MTVAVHHPEGVKTFNESREIYCHLIDFDFELDEKRDGFVHCLITIIANNVN